MVSRRPLALLFFTLILAGCTMGLQRTAYLVKPGTENPVHVVRCEDRPRSGGQWAVTLLMPFGGWIGPAMGYEECMNERTQQGYVKASEPECAYWRDDAKPGDEIKIRESCKNAPPQWTLSRVDAEKAVALAPPVPSQPQRPSAPMAAGSSSILTGTWDGEIFGETHSGQPAAHPYRTLVISSAVEQNGIWMITALYGFKGTSLGPVQLRVSVSSGDQLRLQFLTQANSKIELQLVGNQQLNGSFTTSTTNVTSSCRVHSCPIKFQRMNPPDRATLVRTWSGTANSRSGRYPFTISFRDDGTWHATSPTLQPGNFDGTWQSSGSNMTWKSITTGRSGMMTFQEGNGGRILRMIPEDGTSTVELMPDASIAGPPATASVAPVLGDQQPDEAAIKTVLDSVMDAVNKSDLTRLLDQFADDARIDSKAAGGKVSKQRYGEAMAAAFNRSNVPVVRHSYSRVVIGDAAATVNGTIQLGSRLFPNEWKLKKRAGRWVIVETLYK